jgi:small ligand-binding sensory domain FIST
VSTAFRSGHYAASDWRQAVAACLAQAGDLPGANLGFVYCSDHFADAAAAIVNYLRESTHISHWVGSVGMGVLGNAAEYFDQPAISLMLARLPADSFQVFSGRQRAPALDARTPSGAAAAHFAVVHADPDSMDLAELIVDMAGKVTSGFLVGGLTSSRGTNVQIADDALSGGLSGVVLSSEVAVATRLTQGCTPIGPRHVIDACEHNVIETLDGRPALDVLYEDIGSELAAKLPQLGGYLFAALPVQGADTANYMVRQLVGIDPKARLVAIGEAVEPGRQLCFCRRDAAAAREDLHRMLRDITAGLDAAPKGALYYACVARGKHMFGSVGVETRIIADALGDVPLVGFSCNGEISHDRLYGYTGVLTLFT